MISQLSTAPIVIAAALAFIGGLLSFLSPCVLPLVPAYFGLLMSTSVNRATPPSRSNLLLHAAAFVLGFATIFTVAGLAVGLLLGTVQAALDLVRVVGGVAVIAMGLHLIGVITIPVLYRQAKIDGSKISSGSVAGSFTVGMIFAAGWSPCIGTILTGIFALTTTQPAQAGLLFFAYSLGLGVPFLVAALLLGRFTTWMKSFNRHKRAVSIASGAFLVLVGILLVTNTFALLAAFAPPIEPFGLP